MLENVFYSNGFFSYNTLNPIPLKFASMNNQEYKIEPDLISTNSNGPSFYP